MNITDLTDDQERFEDEFRANLQSTQPRTYEQGAKEEELRSRIYEAILESLGGAYDCTRVWSAWSYGTMGPDDFSLVGEDDERVSEITDAVLRALPTQPPKEVEVCECDWQKVAGRDWYQVGGKGALWPAPMTDCPHCGKPITVKRENNG